jgi:hypothetical protein
MATARKTSTRLTKANAPVYQLRIELVDVQPEVWRTVLIPGSATLTKVHATILWGMGWEGGHLHEFTIGYEAYGMPDPDFDDGRPVKLEGRYTLASAVGKLKSFRYEYDFGDGWEHVIKVEKILPPDPSLKAPVCIAGANACPPEDCGGPMGYEEFLEAIADPKHEDHDDMLTWCGGSFDPTAFDLAGVNARLSEIKL